MAETGTEDAAPGGPGPDAPAGGVAAFFDLDNTLIRGASPFHLAVGLRARGMVSLRDILEFGLVQARYQLFGENRRQIDRVRSRALSLVAGHSVAEMAAIGEEIWDEVLSLRIFPDTHTLLTEHLAAGHEVWIISASPVEIGRLIAARLGATGALGTVAEHVDGFYTGRMLGDLLHGAAKETAVRTLAAERGLDLSRCYAYGDSANDTAILSAVGHPVAINPDARLRRRARKVGWPVREFRGRRSAATRRGVRAASWAGGAWVLGVVARAVRRALRG
ncbi:HAD-IB family hydrolase [Isoptericola sp. b441]|uniref:HAD-IB family hydrolase n=1 Tax=Actinotalea lenta TaxID=3064654 RepID=A0ABT9D6N3_9CELL|nr:MULTISPECIES: HAD-IB family hydrolase [unclassified Isoptericola]MDO8106486.1 HAD-IB family hydrolase [Isoptericola sp. b441]MDO8121798.1 HAD-IB family hydrolase [Isoptericola sp. b490]